MLSSSVNLERPKQLADCINSWTCHCKNSIFKQFWLLKIKQWHSRMHSNHVTIIFNQMLYTNTIKLCLVPFLNSASSQISSNYKFFNFVYFYAILHLLFKLFNWSEKKHTRKWKHVSEELNEFLKTEGKYVIGTQLRKQNILQTELTHKCLLACKISPHNESIKTIPFQGTK